jgi:hypothetical protein
MSEDRISAPRRGAVSLTPVTVSVYQRRALYWAVVDELDAMGDIRINLVNRDVPSALRLRRRCEQALWLLDDLGWEEATERRSFELTMPVDELRPYLERVYWESVGSLAEHPHELVEEVVERLEELVGICPLLLARIAQDSGGRSPAVSGENASELLGKLSGVVERLEAEVGDDG